MTLPFLFAILALICFVLAAFGVSSRVSLTDVGLACLTLSLVILQ